MQQAMVCLDSGDVLDIMHCEYPRRETDKVVYAQINSEQILIASLTLPNVRRYDGMTKGHSVFLRASVDKGIVPTIDYFLRNENNETMQIKDTDHIDAMGRIITTSAEPNEAGNWTIMVGGSTESGNSTVVESVSVLQMGVYDGNEKNISASSSVSSNTKLGQVLEVSML